jgi:hypothetical protein
MTRGEDIHSVEAVLGQEGSIIKGVHDGHGIDHHLSADLVREAFLGTDHS